MATDLAPLGLASLLYLVVLFGIADLTERGILPQRLARHPLVFALSLGVYATSWTLYGSVGFADRQGYDFLAIYIGPTLSCLLVPLVWLPILRLTRNLQLSSLADLFAFRYQSKAAGVIVTLFLVLGSLPYFALQIHAVVEAASFLAPGVPKILVSLTFAATVLVFTVLFGTRHHRIRQPRPGLVVAIAFESVVKLSALLLVGGVAFFGTLGGPDGVQSWLQSHPNAAAELHGPIREAPWVTLLLLSAAAAFLLPRQFHMAFAEQPSERALLHAAWLFPLLLLVLNVGIVPILWAGREVSPNVSPDLYVLAVARTYPGLATVAFLGGVSAASAMVIVGALALAGMCLNHLVMPALRPGGDVYARLSEARRHLVGLMLLAGWIAYVALSPSGGLVQLGLVSFVAVAQFVPGTFGVLFWRRATREGLLVGLGAGIVIWFVLLVLPGFGVEGPLEFALGVGARIGEGWRDRWVVSTTATMTINFGLFALVSLLTRADAEEHDAATVCARDLFSSAHFAHFDTVSEIEARIALVLGEAVARAEVAQALRELGLGADAGAPAELRQLAEHVERNLSGLLGPLPAREVLREAPEVGRARLVLAEQVRFLETQLEELRLDGTAAQVDAARRYLRGVLEDLPTGVCGVDAQAHVMLWNQQMATITGQPASEVVERPLERLPEPWGPLLMDALLERPGAREERVIENRMHPIVVRVERTALSPQGEIEGAVLVLEDLTERRRLEGQVAHQDRLASIGRLAAGVAHEVGNPLTGIVMLSSNLQRETTSEDVRERLGLLIAEAKRIQDIVRNLVDFSRGGMSDASKAPAQPVPVAEVAKEAMQLLQLSRRHRQVGHELTIPGHLGVLVVRARLIQVFLNLLANACDASRPGQTVRVLAEEVGDDVRIDIVDEGEGIPAEDVPHLFDPFFTTKAVGEGTGLGLSVVFSILEASGGRIEVDSRPGEGTRMQVFLPRASLEAST